jgi:poly-D-alanine transfer protein DltD
MIIKEIEIKGEKFRLMLTEQIINQVNNLKTLYSAAYDDPESFEHVSAEISSTIQEISNAVEPKPDSSHLDDLIQQVIKTVDAKTQEANMQSEDKLITKKSKKKSKKTKSKK